jgi:hypothetical protein
LLLSPTGFVTKFYYLTALGAFRSLLLRGREEKRREEKRREKKRREEKRREEKRREEKVAKDTTFGGGARNHIFGWLLNTLWSDFNT